MIIEESQSKLDSFQNHRNWQVERYQYIEKVAVFIMVLLKMPEKLLKVLWNGDFDTICVYEDGTWGIDVKKELISLSKSELTVSSKSEAMNHLMMLSTKLLEATTEEYAELAKKNMKLVMNCGRNHNLCLRSLPK